MVQINIFISTKSFQDLLKKRASNILVLGKEKPDLIGKKIENNQKNTQNAEINREAHQSMNPSLAGGPSKRLA